MRGHPSEGETPRTTPHTRGARPVAPRAPGVPGARRAAPPSSGGSHEGSVERTRAARQKATESGASVDLGRLKIISVVLPVTFVVVGELFRFLFVETDPTHRAEHVALAVILVVSVLAFSAVMFTLIERAQRSVIRQNRELAAVNAVSTAVQGELGVDEVIDAALESVIASTGATEATVTVFPREHGPRGEGTSSAAWPSVRTCRSSRPSARRSPTSSTSRSRSARRSSGGCASTCPRTPERPDLLESATLANIGHQLACSIQMTSADQRPAAAAPGGPRLLRHPAAGLQPAPHRRRPRLGGAARAGAAPERRRGALPDPDRLGPARRREHGSRLLPARRRDALPVHGARALRGPARAPARLPGPLGAGPRSPAWRSASRAPDGPLGDLWSAAATTSRTPAATAASSLTPREPRGIAIASARQRENERQGAILAERERIAREMHDSLAQVLGVTHLRLRALASRERGRRPAGARRRAGRPRRPREEAYRDVREAILGPARGQPGDRGLIESLRAYLEKYTAQSGVTATPWTRTWTASRRSSPRAEVQVIRVIQEALTNVRKHSGASRRSSASRADDQATTIVIEDDGRGFDLAGTLLDRDGASACTRCANGWS